MVAEPARHWPLALLMALGHLLAGCGEAARSPVTTSAGNEAATTDRSGLPALLGAGPAAAGFALAEQPVPFAFPRDHGAHPAFRSEWWYVTAVLADLDRREFGVQFTLFRQGLTPRRHVAQTTEGAAAWRTGQAYMGHIAVSDVAARRHRHEERLARGHPALAGVATQPFKAHIEGWRLISVGKNTWPLRLQADGREIGFDLALSPTKPVVLHGQQGLSRKGADNASYYYSFVRINASGRIVVGGETHEVYGVAWLDHEWSTSVLAPEYAGWDWFALRLDDGRDLMLFRLRRHDGAVDDYNAGTLIHAVGETSALTADDFALTEEDRWRRWPVVWRLALSESAERFVIRAAFADQVMDTSVTYWEGVVHVEDESGQRIGSGYMELTGY